MNPGPGDYESYKAPFDENKLIEVILSQRSQILEWLEQQEMDTISKKKYTHKLEKLFSGGNTAFKEMSTGSKYDRLTLRFVLKYLYQKGFIDLETYTRYKELIKLKKSSWSDDDAYTDEEILELLESTKQKKSRKYYLLLRLAVESGLRRKHCVIAFNKIVKNEEKIIDVNGSVVRIKLFEKSGEKKAFYCYCSKQLVEKIHECGETINYNTLEKKLSYVKFNRIRKWWIDKALDAQIPETVADFIQGRAPNTVRAQFYIQKRKQADKVYYRVLNKILEVVGDV